MKYGLLLIALLALTAFTTATLMLYVHYDCKIRNIKEERSYLLLVLFTGIVGLIIYRLSRKNAKKLYIACSDCGKAVLSGTTHCDSCGSLTFTEYVPENNEKAKSRARLFLVLFVVSFIVINGVRLYLNFSEYSNKIYYCGAADLMSAFTPNDYHYYDKNGNAYYFTQEVLYYTQDGDEYKRVYDKKSDYGDEYFKCIGRDERYKAEDSFIDENGYICFSLNNSYTGKIKYDEKSNAYYDEAGNTYYSAPKVSWDKKGNMIKR